MSTGVRLQGGTMTYREYKSISTDNNEISYIQTQLEQIILSLTNQIDALKKRIEKLEE